MKAGVYKFTNVITGDCYVGSSVDLHRRKLQHLNALKNSRHHSYRFQKAWDECGQQAFDYEVLEEIIITETIKDDLLNREQYWVDLLHPEYNIYPTTGSPLGYHHTEKTKQKISNSTKGVRKSEEHAKHIREAQKGKKLSKEHRKKLSEAAMHRKKESHVTSICIDGIVYNSIKEASEKTKIKYNTIQKRLKNQKFENYFYINQ